MKPDDLKDSLNSIKPDSYMETRLFAAVKDAESPKKKNRRIFKAAACTVLCCAVLVAGVGIGIPKKIIGDSNEDVVVSDVDYSGNYFVMSVYAAEKDKETAIPIDDHTVTFPNFKYKFKRIGKDGMSMVVESKQSLEDCSAFGVSGENIKSVKIKCKTGYFRIHNTSGGDYREYTFEDVFNKAENIIGDDFFLWMPDADKILDNPKKSITELHDTISVEVTFNDGSVQYASYDFSFNDNGELVIDRIAD